ncbi:MAG TPA: tRNA uridine-5-carboxymethylaminomethyl(34) synthesis GTPase MnmE [Clostridiales bacterium]|nr:tRNA uridine-5-carboxymethylaminomethyl(34) synthesis GTPase MnmE [Clostridiales bacterium]
MGNISAISTAPGIGGVAIIRISGDSPLSIAEKMFRPTGKTKVADFEPYKMYVGEIDCGAFTDFGMCVYFKAPKSYTGEDMVEFHCHGGIAISRGVLKRTFELGARPATKGEFTKIAFLNGKMSLSSCEGLIDMINSESDGEVKAGYYLYREKLNAKVKNMQDRLTYALAYIEAGIDYPEEGVTEDNFDEILGTLKEVKRETDGIISSYRSGRKIRQGVKVAILGKPNAGKSSILNALLSYDKAIVSPVKGTTRDAVEGEIDIDGVRFFLYDTAGIRESDDEIESVGIERSRKIMKESDVCLIILDGSEELGEEDSAVLAETEGRPRIIAVNKTDIPQKNGISGDLYVSAKSGENIEDLKRALAEKAFDGKIDLNADFLTEERHFDALKRTSSSLENAIESFGGNTADLCTLDIKDAWDSLGEISGESANERIIDEIFGKFCVGK